MKVYHLICHDVWQTNESSEVLAVFSTFENTIEYLQGYVSRHGFNSTEEGFTVLEITVDEPDSERKVFCTCEKENDHRVIVWFDEGVDAPKFYHIGLLDEKGARDVVVVAHNQDSDKYLSLINHSKLFMEFDSQDELDEFDADEYAFEFTGDAIPLSLGDLIERGVVRHGGVN